MSSRAGGRSVERQLDPYPSFAVYNIRYLSLSVTQKQQRLHKIQNVQHLVQGHDMLAIFESHTNAVKAQTEFFNEIDKVGFEILRETGGFGICRCQPF